MATDTPVPDAAIVAPAVEEETLAEHTKVFGPQRGSTPPAQAPDADPIDGAESADARDGERDAHGRYKGRHRAQKDLAHPDDVPRIKELTKKLRETEAERDRLKATAPVIAAMPAAPSSAPASPPLAPTTPPVPAGLRPRPMVDQYPDWTAYEDDLMRWNREVWASEERVRQDNQRINASWSERVKAAMTVHDDFEEVALKAPTKIPAGSLMDAFILESTAGAEILYALQTDESERERIAALPPVQQAEALALLGQRLTMRPLTASTGSVATPLQTTAPRPPNPVRTGPMRTGDEPVSDDVSVAEHAKAFGPRRRR